ncbi:protein FAM114A2 isoform X2 [Pseudoliparis swirei]|nr:protein FAM114A2 isoform X2 [Pseudoliparis swirei]
MKACPESEEVEMSDREATEAPEAAPEVQEASPVETPAAGSSPSVPDNSTDVAPTRRARRRPDVKPAARAEEEPRVEEQPAKPPTPSESTVAQAGWGYWGSWGKSILSTATATVATVGHGLTQVIEKAETSLGIPSPTELSAQVEEEQEADSSETDTVEVDGSVGGAMGMLSSLSSAVQSTGKTMLTGGLDALEFIGKKTMDVIAEGDPGFKRTKGLMVRNATLSQVLREAKEREQQQTVEREFSTGEQPAAHYGMLFDEFQGLSHLEALELLSRESESKVKSVLTTLSGEDQVQLREELNLIRDSFSLVEFDDEEVDEKKDADGSGFQVEVLQLLDGLGVDATAAKLSQACRSSCSQISDMSREEEEEEQEEEEEEEEAAAKKRPSVEEVHSAAIRTLAVLTARSIELFHKLAEMSRFSGGGPEPGVLLQ